MATFDQIPTDLTLEIEADISPEQFISAARAFFSYVDEIVHALVPSGDIRLWRVRVREGSSLLALDPFPSVDSAIIQNVYKQIEDDTQKLLQGRLQESRQSEMALKHLGTLARLTDATGTGIPIRLWVRRRPVQLNNEIARIIAQDRRAEYRDFGTVEGRLSAIQDNGSLRLQVRDDWLKQTIRCYFPEEKLQEAFSAFRHRVEISGVIRFRGDGTPISVEVETIEVLPDDEELPSAQDVRGLLKATG